MSSQHPPTQNSSTKNPQPKRTLPPDGVSGKYRNENLPQPMYFHNAVYVLSYEGSAWPGREQYGGILGVYTLVGNAQRAGTRWLRDHRGFHLGRSDSTGQVFSAWKVSDDEGGWKKEKAVNGLGFLESLMMKIKKCEMRTDSSLPEEPKEGGGTREKGGEDDEEKGDKEQEDHEGDEQDDVKEKGDGVAVEGMESLII